MTQYIIDALNVDIDEANRLRVGYTVRYGATLLGLVRHHGVDPADFLHVVHTFADLTSMLRAERGLARLVRALPGRKIVLTNAPDALRARRARGTAASSRLFERVIAIEDMRDRAPLAREARRTRCCAARCATHTCARRRDSRRGHARASEELSAARHPHGVDHRPSAAARRQRPVSLRRPGTGRPHYVDQRVRSLRSLAAAQLTFAHFPLYFFAISNCTDAPIC